MKRLSRVLFNVSIFALMPMMANAAGTYYNGNMYQKSQSRYAGNAGNYYNNGNYNYNNRNYNQTMQNMGTRKNTAQQQQKQKQSAVANNKKQGFQMGVGLTHEFADWDFSMDQAGSALRYDGLRWNVVDGWAAYYFGDSFPMQIKVGARYGKQFDEISMVDDDITSQKMWDVEQMNVSGPGGTAVEDIVSGTPAVSVGTSSGGSQMGFNASFGLTDLFQLGNVKITPSLGYRYFKYNLETKNNYGITMEVLNSNSFINCVEVQNGEIQCNPYVGFADGNGVILGFAGFATDSSGNILTNPDGSFVVYNNTGAVQIDTGNSYYYEQSGTSHKYETTWSGPYLALDMEYAVNNDNFISGGLEIGLPIYDSKGDQPYRIDWAHPTSVEDKGEFGDAWHLGLNGNWSTRVSESAVLSFGFTYDYYKVSGATANTYLNVDYYQPVLNNYQNAHNNGTLTEEGELYLDELLRLQSAGWSIENKSEIESIYKSMGIRIGIDVKF